MRYITGFLIALGLIVLIFVIIIKGNSSTRNQQQQQQQQQMQLTDYAPTGTVMRMTMDGPINSNQQHQAVRITIGRDQNTFQLLSGYQGTVTNTKSYPSNGDAYSNFLHSLSLLGFTKNREGVSNDERGYCPRGTRYIYEIIDGDQRKQRTWTSTCSTTQGTFAGQTDNVRALFINQIPDYNTLSQPFRLTQ